MKKAIPYILFTTLAGFFAIPPFAFIFIVLIQAFSTLRQLGSELAAKSWSIRSWSMIFKALPPV